MLNRLWFGSALTSGYGPIDTIYQSGYLRDNLVNYSTWLFDSERPVVLLALALAVLLAIVRARGRDAARRAIVVMCAVFAAAGFASYALYIPLDLWWYLRFLLPAFPPMFVVVSAGLAVVAARCTGRARLLTMGIVISLCAV